MATSMTAQQAEPPQQRSGPGGVLTRRQQRVLQVIQDFGQHHGYAPTLREIGLAAGLASPSSVSYQLTILQRKGYLRRDSGRPRTVEVRLSGQPTVSLDADDLAEALAISPEDPAYAVVPMIGQVPAGDFRPADQAVEDSFMLPKQLVGEGELFLLTVVGDSMINAAIADGDWVVVRRQHEAQHGEIVAAMIGGEATIKTYKRSDGHVWLMPHNPDYAPILGDDAIILGKVVTVLRRV